MIPSVWTSRFPITRLDELSSGFQHPSPPDFLSLLYFHKIPPCRQVQTIYLQQGAVPGKYAQALTGAWCAY